MGVRVMCMSFSSKDLYHARDLAEPKGSVEADRSQWEREGGHPEAVGRHAQARWRGQRASVQLFKCYGNLETSLALLRREHTRARGGGGACEYVTGLKTTFSRSSTRAAKDS